MPVKSELPLTLVALLLLGVGSAWADAGGGWADLLRREAAAGRPLPLIADYVRDPDTDFALAAQREFLRMTHPRRPWAGYQVRFLPGIGPAARGIVFAHDLSWQPPATQDTGPLQLLAGVVFDLRSPIVRTLHSIDDLATYVRSAHAVAVLTQRDFAADAAASDFDLVATNLGLRSWLRGEELGYRTWLGEAPVDVALHHGNERVLGLTVAPRSELLATLLQLVNALRGDDVSLAAGTQLLVRFDAAAARSAPGRYVLNVNGLPALRFDVGRDQRVARYLAGQDTRPRAVRP